MVNKKKWYQKISSYVLMLFFLVIFIILFVSVVILVKAKKYPDEIPDFMGYKPLIVLSGSMEDEIFAGDLVIVKITDPEDLKVDDIIAFRIDELEATTHRIAEITTEDGEVKFVTRGDANNTNDESLVSYDNVEGLYLFRIPGFGSVFMFIQKPLGLAITLLVILVVGVFVIYLNDDKRVSKKELQEFKEFKKSRKNSK